jgi:hypothetical protein
MKDQDTVVEGALPTAIPSEGWEGKPTTQNGLSGQTGLTEGTSDDIPIVEDSAQAKDFSESQDTRHSFTPGRQNYDV